MAEEIFACYNPTPLVSELPLRCSFYVLGVKRLGNRCPQTGDSRTLRLYDVATHEAIRIVCPGCTKIVEYLYGLLQRRHGLRSDMLIFDLQFKLRCSGATAARGSALA